MINIEKYGQQIDNQVVHMDQAACYAPEYLVDRKMRYYPSRIMQVGRAYWKDELPVSEYGVETIFSSILSGQGERWQNFGENANDYLVSTMLLRNMLVEKGYGSEYAKKLEKVLEAENGHIVKIDEKAETMWKESIKTDENSDSYLFIDDATFAYGKDAAIHLGEFLAEKDIVVRNVEPRFAGFEYFAYGLMEKGCDYVKALLDELKAKGVKRVITLSGQTQYLFTTLCEITEINHELEIVSILDYADRFDAENVYIYGGSFNTRYVGNAEKLNALLKDEEETVVTNSWEFVPLVNGKKKRNKVTIWQAPLVPEFNGLGWNPELTAGIFKDGIKEIERASFNKILVCDPYAYHALKEENIKIEYYLNVLA